MSPPHGLFSSGFYSRLCFFLFCRLLESPPIRLLFSTRRPSLLLSGKSAGSRILLTRTVSFYCHAATALCFAATCTFPGRGCSRRSLAHKSSICYAHPALYPWVCVCQRKLHGKLSTFPTAHQSTATWGFWTTLLLDPPPVSLTLGNFLVLRHYHLHSS